MITGLFFGTFDPIHVAHFQVAHNLIQYKIVDRVWFVVTPSNPFKQNQIISSYDHRIAMVRLAIKNCSYFQVSDIEAQLDSPQYTANTLRYIKENHPNETFFIIMGSDNYNNLSTWRDAQFILNNFKICVYKREQHWKNNSDNHVFQIPGEYMNISSSLIRKNIFASKDYLNKDVLKYAIDHSLYN
tara:strand:- start:71 stop:628 length:558 start_codon:yes stop_codon:yes gene_type:complete